MRRRLPGLLALAGFCLVTFTVASDGDWAVMWTRGHLLGAGLVVLGLLVLVGVGGWWIGRRAGRPRGSAA